MRYARGEGGLRAAPLLPAAAAICVLLAGCGQFPAAREMGDMALMRVMGIDKAAAGVAVTGSTGPRASGLQGEGEPSLVLTAERESLSGACLAMQGQSDSYVFFGYVDQLLIGEELAKKGVQPALDYFTRDAELGLGARLWLARGSTAREAVSAGGERGVDSRLATLQTDGKMGIAARSRTAGEVYADLLELGCAYVPALSPSGDGAAVLAERGYGILKGDALAGYLDGEAAQGLELLSGGTSADILEAALPGNRVSVKAVSARTGARLEFAGNTPSALNLTCEVKARLSEYEEPLNDGELEQLRGLLEGRERARLTAALEELRRMKADCAGLGVKAALLRPAQWEAVREDWPEWFAKIPVDVEVQVQLIS